MRYPSTTPLFILVFMLSIFLSCSDNKQNDEDREANVSEEVNQRFDEKLAKKLGADDYGMKKYVMAYLKSGPNRSQDSLERAQLQRAHLDNITRMANEGTLVLAGPFLDDGAIRGIYIFDVETVEEARKLTNTDPAIQAGSLIMELHPWYGSAALKQINELHQKITKTEI